jgi:ATP-grasp ribosomal peptide maturase
MPGGVVAVLTGAFDVTADSVISELNRRRVAVVRCDPGDFPLGIKVGAWLRGTRWAGHLATSNRVLDLEEVVCAWWRRPNAITSPPGTESADWLQRENRAGSRGLLATLPWLNSPDAIHGAEHKALQLMTAAQAGLDVPATLLTNDPDEVRSFATEHIALIYKPLTSGLLEDGRVIYASPVDVDQLDGVELSMNMFQEAISKDHELRVTIVDGNVFTARIDALSDVGRQDWRADYRNLTYTTADLPDRTKAQLRYLMFKLGLRFAAVDMIVTPDGRYVFLEANPNGQFAWIEDETGLPIASAIADALEGRKR